MRKILFIAVLIFGLAWFPMYSAAENMPKKAAAAPTGDVLLLIDTQQRTLTVFNNNQPFKKFRVAVGKPETPSPIGNWKIIRKATNWGSGFGTRFLLLNIPWGIYGIHGTNLPHSIGSRASHGCIRMFNRDVEVLYPWVKVNTPVIIVGNVHGFLQQEWRLVHKGHRGSDVVVIQEALAEWGFYQGKNDGIFGWSTEKALKEFQKSKKLPVTGQVDEDDYHKLGLR